MALSFPTSPSTGDVYLCWQWDSAKWVRLRGMQISVGSTPPTNPGTGDLWWDPVAGALYVYNGAWIGTGVPCGSA